MPNDSWRAKQERGRTPALFLSPIQLTLGSNFSSWSIKENELEGFKDAGDRGYIAPTNLIHKTLYIVHR
ncbi:hypothetical protein FACS1894187_22030 [Synergistales bacterium]|nr:hypothetical protein FACS1894187_22030 [Synergistales bacterium]